MMQTLMTTLMTNKTIATAGNVLPAMTEDIGGIIFDEIAHYPFIIHINGDQGAQELVQPRETT